MSKIGLYFGSFNPIHIGHMAIANYFVEFSDIDQIWLVVSPHNPLKDKSTLLPDYTRLDLVHMAIGDDMRYKASDIEFNLPKPSFTIDTLTYLKEKYPEKEFVLLLGSDNLESFHKWKNYNEILNNNEIYIYPRPGFDASKYSQYKISQIVNAPHIEISSSFIRNAIKEGKNVTNFMTENVAKYVDEMNFYKK